MRNNILNDNIVFDVDSEYETITNTFLYNGDEYKVENEVIKLKEKSTHIIDISLNEDGTFKEEIYSIDPNNRMQPNGVIDSIQFIRYDICRFITKDETKINYQLKKEMKKLILDGLLSVNVHLKKEVDEMLETYNKRKKLVEDAIRIEREEKLKRICNEK